MPVLVVDDSVDCRGAPREPGLLVTLSPVAVKSEEKRGSERVSGRMERQREGGGGDKESRERSREREEERRERIERGDERKRGERQEAREGWKRREKRKRREEVYQSKMRNLQLSTS